MRELPKLFSGKIFFLISAAFAAPLCGLACAAAEVSAFCEEALTGKLPGPTSIRRFNGVRFSAVRIEQGPNGGFRVILKRRTPEPKEPDTLENSHERWPGNVLRAFGDERTAAFFGLVRRYFEIDGAMVEEASIPDVQELNGVIRAINAAADDPEFLPITFYSAGSKVDVREYLGLFSEKGQLPVASKGHYFIHDITAHMTAIFLPLDVIRLSQLQARLLLAFEAFVRRDHPSVYKKSMFDEMSKRVAENIDFGNGNYVLELSQWDEGYLSKGISQMIDGGRSPLESLEHQILLAGGGKEVLGSFLAEFSQLHENRNNPSLRAGIDKSWIEAGQGKGARAAVMEKIARLCAIVNEASLDHEARL